MKKDVKNKPTSILKDFLWYLYQRSAIPVCRRSIPIPIPPEGQGQYPIPIPILQSAWGQYPIPIPILFLPKGQYQYQYWPKVLYFNIFTNNVLLNLLSGKETNSIESQKWYCYFHSVKYQSHWKANKQHFSLIFPSTLSLIDIEIFEKA